MTHPGEFLEKHRKGPQLVSAQGKARLFKTSSRDHNSVGFPSEELWVFTPEWPYIQEYRSEYIVSFRLLVIARFRHFILSYLSHSTSQPFRRIPRGTRLDECATISYNSAGRIPGWQARSKSKH